MDESSNRSASNSDARVGIFEANGVRSESTTTRESRNFFTRTTRLEKKLYLELSRLQAQYPQADIEQVSEDEHASGLQPVLRRVWTPVGEPPIAGVKTQYQWLWLYGFVHPESGENYWWIRTYTNAQLFNRVLADFAREFQLSRNKRVLLVLDQAGWHTSQQLELPEGLDLYFLPAPVS